jgi:hypothetical protein
MKKQIFIIIAIMLWKITNVMATWPDILWTWLPWYEWSSLITVKNLWNNNVWIEFISSLIWQAIQFIAVIAVIALILSGIMYLLSWWDDEKAKKAKSWITWSLLWVILSISAWWIIGILNKINIW